MIIDVYGKARIQHADTGVVYEINNNLLDFYFADSDDADIGVRTMYSAYIQHPQLGKLTWEIWEYPLGTQEGNPTHHFGTHKLLEDFKFDCSLDPDQEDALNRVGMLVAWFLENYEDPAHRVSYESREGGYQWNFGGPYDAGSELRRKFPHEHEDIIELAIEEIEVEGTLEWSPIPNSKDSVVEDLFPDHELKDFDDRLNTLIDNAPKAKTDPAFDIGDDNRLHIIPPPDNQPVNNKDDLLDELRTMANTLLESFKGENAYPRFLPIVKLYSEALSSEQISISRLYARGIRLANLAQEISRDKTELSLPAHIKSELDSTLKLNGAYIMSDEEGQKLVNAATAYHQHPQQTVELKDAIEQLSNNIKNAPTLFSADVREHVPDILKDMGRGQHPERSNQSAGNTLTNMFSGLLSWVKRTSTRAISEIAVNALVDGATWGSATGALAINVAVTFLINAAPLLTTILASLRSKLSWLTAVSDILERIRLAITIKKNEVNTTERNKKMTNEKEKDAIWKKAKPMRGLNPDVYRKDAKGKKIRRASYGKQTNLGWEIDHIKPTAKGGKDTLANKQPLQWKANRIKSDKFKKPKR